ncbi:glutamate racemase [Parendozoicomonas haliclonae]|uniref:Glutamate racemase n=1 Tax=Parendozoicomonas haliclonae TaxID=1960125 RepID=A0A1X7AK38_9GAMM|nr:glutamate racemase [Parendozoicomonas haliclonae]SMA46739.1 Glutamate racemase [Parendozoicomonas haliclonae]
MNPIVILDSGAGGLTVFDEINRMMPWLPVVYCADNAGFPYGPKPEDEVTERVCHYLSLLNERYSPALVVIACNTASTVALTAARERLDIPVVGVVPAIKTAATLSQNRCIGLLATPGTVNRNYTDNLIHEFASDCSVIKVGSTDLVHIAESSFCGEAISTQKLETILHPFLEADVQPDHIVLGCTHFPLVREELSTVMPDVTWVDSGEAIARRVFSLLGNHINEETATPKHIAHLTGDGEQAQLFTSAIAGRGFHALSVLP